MKCPMCNGKGKVIDYVAERNCHEEWETVLREIPCDKCQRKPQTNEEWFCGLSTEEKAKEIYKIAKDDFKELRKLFYGVANDDHDAVALWLKQTHKE